MIPAGPGKSHQSMRDISLFGAIPNVTIIQPCNALETKKAVEYCVNEAKENCVIRLVIGPSPELIKLPDNYEFTIGIGTELNVGSEAILFAYGPVMLHEALTASHILEKVRFGLKVINMPWLNKIDLDWIENVTKNYKNIFVLEDHSIIGGLGDRILEAIADIHHIYGKKFHKLGIDDYPECGTPLEVLKFHEIDGLSLAKRISGIDDLENRLEDDKLKNKYTADAPQ